MGKSDLIRQWAADTMASAGLSVAEWARLSGVSRSTIHRVLDERYQFTPSTQTLTKLARAANAKFGAALEIYDDELALENPDFSISFPEEKNFDARTIKITKYIGVWDSAAAPDRGEERSPLVYNARYPSALQWAGVVVGHEVSSEYHYGDLVHAVDIYFDPRPGDHVILSTARNDAQDIRLDVRRVVSLEKDRATLAAWPPAPGVLQKVSLAREEGQVEGSWISALILGQHRLRP